ncbi:MAG: DNA polymerase Y family protein [Abyssibacter sp.]|nr:DNA polymerase Y family protein [Abyssibacter sp.]MCK5858426.1 DNA polymerase Y family protein [Abyssibacter sp.]
MLNTQTDLFEQPVSRQKNTANSLRLAPPPRPQPAQTAPTLWLCLYLEQLPLEVFPHFEPEDLVAVTDSIKARTLVISASQAAMQQGVTADMSVTAAHAICPSLHVLPRDSRAEGHRLQWLARWASRFSSWVSVEPPHTIYLEIAGSRCLFGSPRELQRSLRGGLGAHGHQARTAVAPTARAAGFLARWATHDASLIEQAESLHAAIGQLPITALELPPKSARRMTRSGLHTLQDLLRLPRDGLARRFGQSVLEQLDQALGKAPQALPMFSTPQRFSADVDLPQPSAASPHILAAAEHVLDQLCDYLRAHDRAVERFICRLFHHRREATLCQVGLRSPDRNPRRFSHLLAEHLNRMALPAEVIALRIEVSRLLPFDVGTTDWLDNRGTDDWLATVELWQARLGMDAIRRLGTHADHRPEYAFTVNAHDSGCWPSASRPLYLLDSPSALQVKDRTPICGSALTRIQGPERIEQGWWDGVDISRDYYVMSNSRGARLWVYQDRRELGWWLHGVFA